MLPEIDSVELKRDNPRRQQVIRFSADRSAVRQKKQDRFIPVFTNTVVWVVISVTASIITGTVATWFGLTAKSVLHCCKRCLSFVLRRGNLLS